MPLPLFGLFRRLLGSDKQFRQAVATVIGQDPHNARLYQLAFTHSSVVKQATRATSGSSFWAMPCSAP
jgi:ribonuclease-3